MSLAMPLPGHSAHEAVQAALPVLATLGDMANVFKLPNIFTARMNARKAVEDKAIKSVESLVILSDGELVLIRFGKRGGRKTLWKFGKI